MEQAASLANYQVAYHLLTDGARAEKGQSILVYGAAGGMGNALIDLAKAQGLQVIGVVSSDGKARFAKELGADHVVNRRTENVVERVKAITAGRGVDLIADPAGGPSIPDNLSMLATMGMLIVYGGLGGRAQIDLAAELAKHMGKCLAVRRFSIHYLDHLPEPRRKGMRALIDMLAKGTIRPRIYTRLPLAEARRAHEILERGDVMGKLLLQP
jgi:NADPH2:quinone reductase